MRFRDDHWLPPPPPPLLRETGEGSAGATGAGATAERSRSRMSEWAERMKKTSSGVSAVVVLISARGPARG